MDRRQTVFEADARRDWEVCGCSLVCDESARVAAPGAHEPTPTPYFVLDELFLHVDFDKDSHLLDVGCGTGRVLAYVASRLPGRATGIELDGVLVARVRAWAQRYQRLDVRCGNVLDEPLAPYTHFYLFNPFDTEVLVKFLDKVEAEATRPVTLIHMSDNGERYVYLGRPGWTLEHEGSIQGCHAEDGSFIPVYGCPQTWSIWRYIPADEKILSSTYSTSGASPNGTAPFR